MPEQHWQNDIFICWSSGGSPADINVQVNGSNRHMRLVFEGMGSDAQYMQPTFQIVFVFRSCPAFPARDGGLRQHVAPCLSSQRSSGVVLANNKLGRYRVRAAGNFYVPYGKERNADGSGALAHEYPEIS